MTMTELTWQKSSFSEAGGANCLYLAAVAPVGTVHLRESDRPGTVLTTTPDALAALIRALAPPGHRRPGRVTGPLLRSCWSPDDVFGTTMDP
jgi:hypothetical protein